LGNHGSIDFFWKRLVQTARAQSRFNVCDGTSEAPPEKRPGDSRKRVAVDHHDAALGGEALVCVAF
jgi:hypothetical protein